MDSLGGGQYRIPLPLPKRERERERKRERERARERKRRWTVWGARNIVEYGALRV